MHDMNLLIQIISFDIVACDCDGYSINLRRNKRPVIMESAAKKRVDGRGTRPNVKSAHGRGRGSGLVVVVVGVGGSVGVITDMCGQRKQVFNPVQVVEPHRECGTQPIQWNVKL